MSDQSTPTGGTVVEEKREVVIPERKPKFKHHPHVWLCVVLTAGELALLYIIFIIGIPVPNKEIAYLLIGGYTAEWANSVRYFYGTTFGSLEKNTIIAKAGPVDPH